ncbi:hypothetical protein HGM15179_004761 [Zosterops borbonicus]|uniref:Uncharacterized protein n=1 Tax=Zosterops borbonicus TaxID=364589 RepID=A0A8K1GQN9_9PASS|nr:hypothetical protein HGM15179_004761 [Zosterops borbonicus]
MVEALELDDLSFVFRPKPFHDFMKNLEQKVLDQDPNLCNADLPVLPVSSLLVKSHETFELEIGIRGGKGLSDLFSCEYEEHNKDLILCQGIWGAKRVFTEKEPMIRCMTSSQENSKTYQYN